MEFKIRGIFMDKICGNGLTKREIEVLKLLVKGYSNYIIAKKLCVNECTVKAHIRHIFEKMNVQNRVQIAVKAIKENIVQIF